MNKVYIGIDPGVDTGCAIIMDGEYVDIRTKKAVEVEIIVESWHRSAEWEVEMWVENPNLRQYFGNKDRESLQGAGSIKRDYSRWVEYAEYHGIKLVPISPQMVGSMFDKVPIFAQATGWKGRTSKHARDAARMIYRFYKPIKK